MPDSIKFFLQPDPASATAIRKLVTGALKDIAIDANASRIRASIAKELQRPFFVNVAPSQKSIREFDKLLAKRSFKVDFQITNDQLKNAKDIIQGTTSAFNDMSKAKDAFAANVRSKFPAIISQVKTLNKELAQSKALFSSIGVNNKTRNIGNAVGKAIAPQAVAAKSNALQVQNQTIQSINQATKATNRLAKATASVAKETDTFTGRIALTTSRLGAYAIASNAIFAVVSGVSQSFKAILEIDKNLNRLTQILNDNAEAADNVTNKVLSFAKAYGQSGRAILNIVDTLAQAGNQFSGENSLVKAAEAIAKTNLAATFGDIESTTSGVIAILNQFNLSAADTARVLDVSNKVAKDFAVEAGDIFKAVRSGGGAFAIAGGNIEQFTALVGTLRQTTRLSAEQIGTFINALSVRSLRPEVVELIDRITAGGSRNSDGGLKSLTDRLIAFAEATKGLSDEQLTPLIEQLVELRQAKFGIPLIRGLQQGPNNLFAQQLRAAEDSAGSLSQDAIKGLERLDVQIGTIGAKFDELFKKIGQDPAFRRLVGEVVTLTKAFAGLIETVGPFLPFLLKLGTLKLLSSVGGKFLGGLPAAPGRRAGQNRSVSSIVSSNGSALNGAGRTTLFRSVNSSQANFVPFANSGRIKTNYLSGNYTDEGIRKATGFQGNTLGPLIQSGMIIKSGNSYQINPSFFKTGKGRPPGNYTDEGIRKTFNIPNGVSLAALSKTGVLKQQNGQFSVNSPQSFISNRNFNRPVGRGPTDINNIIGARIGPTIGGQSGSLSILPPGARRELELLRKTLADLKKQFSNSGGGSLGGNLANRIEEIKGRISSLSSQASRGLIPNAIGRPARPAINRGPGIASTRVQENLLLPGAQGGRGGPGGIVRARDTFPFANIPLNLATNNRFESPDDPVRGSAGLLSTATAARIAGVSPSGGPLNKPSRFGLSRGTSFQRSRVRLNRIIRDIRANGGNLGVGALALAADNASRNISDNESILTGGQLNLGAVDDIQRRNRNRDIGRGALTGAASGAILGASFGGPIGGAVGAAGGAIVGGVTARNSARTRESRELLNAAGLADTPEGRAAALNKFGQTLGQGSALDSFINATTNPQSGRFTERLKSTITPFGIIEQIGQGAKDIRNTFFPSASNGELNEALRSPEGEALQQKILKDIENSAKNTDPTKGNVLGQIRENFIDAGVKAGGGDIVQQEKNRNRLTQIFSETVRGFGLENISKIVNTTANETKKLGESSKEASKQVQELFRQAGKSVLEFFNNFDQSTRKINEDTLSRSLSSNIRGQSLGNLFGSAQGFNLPQQFGEALLSNLQTVINDNGGNTRQNILQQGIRPLVGAGVVSGAEGEVLADLGAIQGGLTRLNTQIISAVAGDTFGTGSLSEAVDQQFGSFAQKLIESQGVEVRTEEGRNLQKEITQALIQAAQAEGGLEKFNKDRAGFVREILGNLGIDERVSGRTQAALAALNQKIEESRQAFETLINAQQRVADFQSKVTQSRLTNLNLRSQFGLASNNDRIAGIRGIINADPNLRNANSNITAAGRNLVSAQNDASLNGSRGPLAQAEAINRLNQAQNDYNKALSDGQTAINIFAEAAQSASEELDKINQARAGIARTDLSTRSQQAFNAKRFDSLTGQNSAFGQELNKLGVNSVADFNKLSKADRDRLIQIAQSSGLTNNPEISNGLELGGFGIARSSGSRRSLNTTRDILDQAVGAGALGINGFEGVNEEAANYAQIQADYLRLVSENSSAQLTSLNNINDSILAIGKSLLVNNPQARAQIEALQQQQRAAAAAAGVNGNGGGGGGGGGNGNGGRGNNPATGSNGNAEIARSLDGIATRLEGLVNNGNIKDTVVQLAEVVKGLEQKGIKLSIDGQVVVNGLEKAGRDVAIQQAVVMILENFTKQLDKSNPAEAALAEKFNTAMRQIGQGGKVASAGGVRTQSVITESTA